MPFDHRGQRHSVFFPILYCSYNPIFRLLGAAIVNFWSLRCSLLYLREGGAPWLQTLSPLCICALYKVTPVPYLTASRLFAYSCTFRRKMPFGHRGQCHSVFFCILYCPYNPIFRFLGAAVVNFWSLRCSLLFLREGGALQLQRPTALCICLSSSS